MNHNEDNTVDKAPGEIVAAKYTPDGKWYRARVLIVEESRMRVCMIRYFTDHSVSKTNDFQITLVLLYCWLTSNTLKWRESNDNLIGPGKTRRQWHNLIGPSKPKRRQWQNLIGKFASWLLFLPKNRWSWLDCNVIYTGYV